MVPTEELEGYRRSRLRRFLPFVLAAVAVAVALPFLLRPASSKAVPEFELNRLSGNGTISSDDLKGSVVVLNFWASWCIPCQEEAPILEAAWNKYRDEGVRFLGVNIQDTEDNAKLFVKRFGLTFPMVRDPEQVLAKELDVYGLPQTFFVNEDWTFSAVEAKDRIGDRFGTQVLGAITAEELDEQIQALVDGG